MLRNAFAIAVAVVIGACVLKLVSGVVGGVLGLLLGLAGVVLILHDRPMGGDAGWGWLASGVSLVSITLGTLYQRRYCGGIDWRSGTAATGASSVSPPPPWQPASSSCTCPRCSFD